MRKKARFEKFIALGVILAMIFQTLTPFTAVVSANAEAEVIPATGEEIVESAETSSETTETVKDTETETSEVNPEVESGSTETSSPADQDDEEKKLRNKILALVAKDLGVDLDKNASFYAQHAGIENYRGTRDENKLLKEYLISNRFSLPNPEEADNAAWESSDTTVPNTTNDTGIASETTTTIENESGVVLENTSFLDERKSQNSSGSIENTLDKSNWPSMIADRSNEGEVLDPNAVLRNANTGKTSVDVREATSDGSEARTEFWVGEQISTNAVIDNSGLGAQLRARGKITFPKAYVNGRPTFVQEKSMRDYAITEDADNRYVDFKITIDDGKKVALPMFFSMKNNDNVPNGFETAIKFELFDEFTDAPIDSHATIYKSKTVELKSVIQLYTWMDKGHNGDHGKWDTDVQNNPRVTGTDWYTFYEGYTSSEPVMERYSGWSEWYVRLLPVNANEAPNGWGRSYPANNKVVVTIPEGTVPSWIPNTSGQYCYNWGPGFCWTYDEQARTMIYEGGKRHDEYIARFDLRHIDQPYYLNSEKTEVNYHTINIDSTINPDTQYKKVFPSHTVSIGWTPKLDRVTPWSSIASPKHGGSESYYDGIIYTPDLSTFDLYYGIYPTTTHTLNDTNYQKTYTIKSLLDYNLDERLYYKSLRFTYWNVAGYDLTTTPHKIMGIRADGGEDLLGENLTAINQVLEINDSQDQYTAIKLVFPDTITTKHLDFDLRVDVAVKDFAKADVEAKVVDQNDRAAWDKKWNDVTDTSWKYFNASKLEYTEQGSDESKYIPTTGFIYFKSDYVTSHAWKENGDYVVPYSTDPSTQVRDIESNIEIRKRDFDGSPWTEYSINNMGLNNVKYIALLPEGIQYVPGSVTEKSGKKYWHQIPEPTIIPNYKETGKTGLIFDLWDLRKDKPWRAWHFWNPFKFSILVTNDTAEWNNYVDGYFFRDEEPGYIDVWASFVDKYDFDGDGDITEKFHQIWSTRITYTQRRDVVLKNTLSSSATGNFASSAVLDTVNAKPYYKFNLFNNYIEDMEGLSLITTLPKVNDTAIVPTQDWTYPKRWSELSLHLSGSLETDPNNAALLEKWNFLYSIDPQSPNIEKTKNANWLTASEISDFSKVTMIKIVQKSGKPLRQKELVDFYVPILLPDHLAEKNSLLHASASTAFSTNNITYIEANKITFSFVPGYRIEWRVFADENNDGAYEWDQFLEGYQISLFHVDGTPVINTKWAPMTTLTDNEWRFFFRVLKRGTYYLSMTKKMLNDTASKPFELNGVRIIGVWNDAFVNTDDATNMTLKSTPFILDPYTVSSETDIYQKPSSFIAVRNFWILLQNGRISLELLDASNADYPLSGAEFELQNEQGKKIANLKTDENWIIKTELLPFWTYILIQKTTVPNYKILTEKRIVVLNQAIQNEVFRNIKERRTSSGGGGSQYLMREKKVSFWENKDSKILDTNNEVLQSDMTDPIVYRELDFKKNKNLSQSHSLNLPIEENTKIKTYVKTLPKTGVLSAGDLQKKVGIRKNAKVETDLPNAETFKLAGSTQTALAYWLQVLPKQDQKADQYVVLPKQWLVMPINTVSEKSKAYKNFINGKNENFQSQLHNGAVQLPGTSLGDYGQVGNKVIAGHSSYWKSSSARYKTHFQKIIGMSQWEEVRVYKKTSQGWYQRYVYRVNASYNTDDNDISVLKPTANDQLTLMTCTPIGGVAGRWIVKASFASN